MADVFKSSIAMRHCHVLKKVDRCVCFDMYDDQNGAFILGCAMGKSMKGYMFLTTIENTHRLDISELLEDMDIDKRIVAILSNIDSLTGLDFTLNDKRDRKVCVIKFESRVFTSSPVAFSLDLHFSDNSDISENTRSTNNHKPKDFFDNFSCFSDSACLDYTEEEEIRRARGSSKLSLSANSHQYSTMQEANGAFGIVHLHTKAPVWNTELRQWLHNFGGRVRFPTYKCFLVTDSSSAEQEGGAQNRVCIRHGKVALSSYILDFRQPVSPIAALAALCAVHANKTLVNL